MKKCLCLIALVALLTACSTVHTRTNPYLGGARYPATVPDKVQILNAEPNDRPHDRLGEIFLDIDGDPSRDKLEKKLRTAAANLGAEAVFIVHDQTHIFPVVYMDYWWGPNVSQAARRGIIAVAIKFK
jgi:hypothetical protein